MPIFNFRGKDKKEKIKKKKNSIDIGLAKNMIVAVTDKTAPSTAAPAAEHKGKFLDKKDSALIFGIYFDRKDQFGYQENDVVSISFTELQAIYSFDAKILAVREAFPGSDNSAEDFEIDEEANKLGSIYGYDKYIVEVLPLSDLEKHQRREFFRMPLEIDIYYKPVEESELPFLESGDLRFELARAREAKNDADEGLLEEEDGYLKLKTVCLSAGGFRCRTAAEFEEGTFLNCMLIVGYEALPAAAKILRVRPDEENPDLYDVRAVFHRISDPVRDRIVKHIFLRQTQMQARFARRRP